MENKKELLTILTESINTIKESEKKISDARSKLINTIDSMVNSFADVLKEKGIYFIKTAGMLEKYLIKFKDNDEIFMGFDIDSDSPEKGFFISYTLDTYTKEFIPFEDFTSERLYTIILSAKVRLEIHHLKKMKEIKNMI